MMSSTYRRVIRWLAIVGALTLLGTTVGGVGVTVAAAKTRTPKVLYVGALHGITTPAATSFTTIQAAVDAATPGDWILIAPGDYHEEGDMGADAPSPSDVADGWYGGVDIATPRIHLRGMNRSSVIVDGTLPSAAGPCRRRQPTRTPSTGRVGTASWSGKQVA